MVAKPIAILGLAVASLLAASCANVTSQESSRTLAQDTADPSDVSGQEAPADQGQPTETESEAADSAATTPESSTQAVPNVTDRGGRNIGSESTTSAPTQGDLASVETPATTEPATDATADPTTDPTAVPTTAPVVPDGAATATPEPAAAPEPTAVPVPSPTPLPPTPVPTSAPVISVPTATGPVPSDNIVVQGPAVDESESPTISDAGALACTVTESAIDFLDLGDLNRMAATLQQAGQHAQQASEPEIAAMASILNGAGPSEDAAFEAIVATLNACAIHGYQV